MKPFGFYRSATLREVKLDSKKYISSAHCTALSVNCIGDLCHIWWAALIERVRVKRCVHFCKFESVVAVRM